MNVQSQGAEALNLRQKQVAMFWNIETLTKLIEPMTLEAKQKVYAMGDDTPPGVLNDIPGHIVSMMKQQFVQVTAPTLDSIKERGIFNTLSY